MMQYVIKVLLSATLIVAVAEIAKRSTLWAAATASLPLVSILAMVWLYLDTGSTLRVAELSRGILWLVLPSLVLFLVLPPLLRAGVGFWPSLAGSIGATVLAYGALLWILKRAGIAI